MAVKIKIEKFEGPLDLLLQLIEQEELSITEVSLSKITDQYLAYLKEIAEYDPDDLADFLVIAAKLLLIKSRELLPGVAVQEDEGPSLEAQLKMYKIFWEAAVRLGERIKKGKFLFYRDKLPGSLAPRFSPPPSVTQLKLYSSFLDVLQKITPVVKYPEERMKKTISIQEKISRIREIVGREATVRFRDILRDSKSKTEIVVNFLALLELIKGRTIFAEQDEAFGEIVIKRQAETQPAPAPAPDQDQTKEE